MLLSLSSLLLLAKAATALDNGLALTPPMGWSTWNLLNCNINETLILDAARGIKKAGLLSLGYTFINIDDCWQADSRHPTTHAPREDPLHFPSGMGALVDEIHKLGFKAGIYSSGGSMTCQRLFGSLDYEEIDAKTYALWGFDSLKYDNCHNEGRSGTPKLSYDRYNTMRNALNATGRPFLYQLCNWGEDGPWNWATTLTNTWRMSGDITASFDREDDRCGTCAPYTPCQHYGYKCSVMNIIEKAAAIVHKGYKGSWPDLDSLEIGVGDMSHDEEIAHMSVWSLVKSPLMLGHDPAKISPAALKILSNRKVLAVSQDPLGKPGYRIWKKEHPLGSVQLWKGDLVDSTFAMLLINATPEKQHVRVDMRDFFVDEKSAYAARSLDAEDLWADGACIQGMKDQVNITVPARGARMFKLKPEGRGLCNGSP